MESKRLTEGCLCEGYNCTERAAYIVHDRMADKVLLLCASCEAALNRQIGSEYDHECPNCGCTSYIN